jgi:RNA polymerase sigma-70 factor (sigma-E family)
MTSTADYDEFAATRWPALVRSACLMTGDWQHAEDLAQATLVKAWRHWRRVSGADDPDRYVRKVLVNEFLRTRSRWRRHEELATDSGGTVEGSEVAFAERDALARGLARVPRGQRAVLVLRYYLDVSEQDVAASLGCSVGNVKSQAARGLARLRQELEDFDLATKEA